jgi:hypothetical protein
MSLDITEQRLELFQSLFKGRQDAIAVRKEKDVNMVCTR